MAVAALDFLSSPLGSIPRVSTSLSPADIWGGVLARINIGRMAYSVKPGLYAVGTPTEDSPVLVSANYKLSFDALRSQLTGIDAWILVLDTKGINVWCAAGKGSFGTHEIVKRVRAVGLERLVRHRLLILPQLGAPGVSAHGVHAMCGFRVLYGPVRAADLPEYLSNGRKKRPAMKKMVFPLTERLKLIPVELFQAWPFILIAGFFGMALKASLQRGLSLDLPLAALPYLYACLAGAVISPALLPWIPFRAFSLKGALCAALGLGAWWILASVLGWGAWTVFEGAGILLNSMAISAYLSLNFTGASSFTSLSGVRREMKAALSLIIGALVLGVVLSLIAAIKGAS